MINSRPKEGNRIYRTDVALSAQPQEESRTTTSNIANTRLYHVIVFYLPVESGAKGLTSVSQKQSRHGFFVTMIFSASTQVIYDGIYLGKARVSQSLKGILLILQIAGSRDLFGIVLRNIQDLPSGSAENETDATLRRGNRLLNRRTD